MSRDDRYRAPGSSVEDRSHTVRRAGVVIIAICYAGVAIISAVVASALLHQYAETYVHSSSRPVPSTTRFVLDSAWRWWLLAGLGAALAAWVVRTTARDPRLHSRQRLVLILLIAGLAANFAIDLFFVYLPEEGIRLRATPTD